jgi:hypothetical protein
MRMRASSCMRVGCTIGRSWLGLVERDREGGITVVVVVVVGVDRSMVLLDKAARFEHFRYVHTHFDRPINLFTTSQHPLVHDGN